MKNYRALTPVGPVRCDLVTAMEYKRMYGCPVIRIPPKEVDQLS